MARQVECEKGSRTKPEPKEDQVLVRIDDLHNTGCGKETWRSSGAVDLRMWVEVTDFDDAPTIALFKKGEDVCASCQRGDVGCCRPRNFIETDEEKPIAFGSHVAIMYDSPEFLNLEFPSYQFRTHVTVSHGTLSFPTYDDPNEDLWYPPDFEWLLPTNPAEQQPGAQCSWDKVTGSPTDCAANGYRGFTVRGY